MTKLIHLEEEILASRIHDIWSKWFLHQLSNSSPENIERWMYQSSTDYADLSEEDKEKDRKQVRKLLEGIKTIDPIAIIDEMIDEIDTDNETLRFLYREKLKELKSRLSLTQK